VPTVATAGHVDHGKSTLVRALTGTDPDRLAEERRRGLTLDLGFGACTLPSGTTLGFVDVPGHERYLTNMLAGVGAVDACLFVVAADEGWRAQSEEHLRLLELLGVRRAVVAVSRTDLADADRIRATVGGVHERFGTGPVEVVGVVPVDARHGDGIVELSEALDRLVAAVPSGESDLEPGRTRLWVDRSFAVTGAGAVVTGTLAFAPVTVGERLLVGGREARVRGLQHHGASADRVDPGERVAVNLTGVRHHDVRRGDALVAPGRWHLTTTLDATLTVLEDLGHPVSRRGAWTLHIGSGHHPVRVRVLGPGALAPGSTGWVRIHLPTALPLVPGDRFVLREAGRDETVGGGEVLDVDPVLPAAHARPSRDLDRVVAERGRVEVDELERLTGRRRQPTVGRWVLDDTEVGRRRAALAGDVERAGPTGVEVGTYDELDRLLLPSVEVAGRPVDVRDGIARAASAADEASPAAVPPPWVDAMTSAPLEGVRPDGVDPAELRALRRTGQVRRVGDVWFSAAGLDRTVGRLAAVLVVHPDGATVADVRAALGGSRRTLIPFLTWCDEQGITRRRGDVRIAGPRLPDPPGSP
jgi:selenocysteine-specific elongation factor